MLATTSGGTVTTRENGVYTWDGRVLDEGEDDVDRPVTMLVAAVFLLACAAIVFASLPALASLGLLAIRPEELSDGLAGLAVGVCGVLGALRLVAAARNTYRRLRPRRPAMSIAASAD